MASPVTKWFNASVGRKIDDDGAYGAQCMDLYADYQRNCLKVTVKGAPAAKDVWNNNSYNTSAFTKIANTPSFVPQRGDVCVWTNGTYGHIAVCTGEGNIDYFVSLDQNWFSPWNGTGPATYVRHNYDGVAGFLRPKQDINFDQEAVDAANAAAKAEADRLAKLEAERVAAEQKKLAEEQAKLAAELKAKLEADTKAEDARLEAERMAKEKAEADAKAEEIKKEEIIMGSPRFDLSLNDLKKAALGSLYTFLGSLGALMLPLAESVKAGTVDLNVFGLAVAAAMISALANLLKRFVTDTQ